MAGQPGGSRFNQTQHITLSNTHLQTGVSREFKERFARVAQAQGVSESALLRRLLEQGVLTDRTPGEELITRVDEVPSACRVSVRLRPDDLSVAEIGAISMECAFTSRPLINANSASWDSGRTTTPD